MAAKKKKGMFLYLVAAIIILGILYLIFNEHGLIKYSKLKNELDSLNTQITKLQQDNEMLKNEIDSLKKGIPAKIEKIAREKYDMIKEGERTIELKKSEDDEK
ncbi:MAG: septum formation initiator family protein [Ignavibacteriaceae bacterium]